MEALKKSKAAARTLRSAQAEQKNQALRHLGDLLHARESEILKANAQDLAALDPAKTPAFRDRLTLTKARVEQMIASVRQVEALPDPVGEITATQVLENGLRVRKIRAPLGVILMIFESRPNVAIEAFSLALKSGNVMILKGGKESVHSTAALYALITEALVSAGLPAACLWGIADPDRKLIEELLKQTDHIDVVVPRGGEQLIDFVVKHSKIPIIKNDRGLCHVYAHEDADVEMARKIVINAKVQRPGVCNSMETLLVHERLAPQLLPKLFAETVDLSVKWHACTKTLAILGPKAAAQVATDLNFSTEYLDLEMNCRIVSSLEEALAHIDRFGSRHSEAILTASEKTAKKFESEVDAAVVYWNASTRFTDGFELGLGGELGISTQKLHVRGPVGLRELTSERWIIEGTGQTRR